MQTLNISMDYLNAQGLTNAIRAALGVKCFGLSDDGRARPISIWLDDTATPGDLTTATNLANAHDPVSLTADKTSVQSDGVDTATISVAAPKPGAAAVTLVCTKPDSSQVTQAVTLNAGAGTVAFKTIIPGTYTITVQNPANRSGDSLTIEAI